MQRRRFIRLLSGTVVTGLAAARAQPAGRPRKIGIVMLYPENDPQGQLRAGAFQGQLEKAGWKIGDALRLDFQWGTGDSAWVRAATDRALKLSPDLLLANGDAAAHAALQLAKAIPVVFIASGDPVKDGLVQSLAHPGANVTGFAVMEPTLGAKLLGMLKQVAPRVSRVAVLINPDSVTHAHILASLQIAAAGFAVDVESASARDRSQIEAAISMYGSSRDYGLIVPSDPAINAQRKLLVELAARYHLPAIFALRSAVTEGGLMSYGVDIIELFRQAAIYSDRILKGEKPADLPVQLPTKFEMTVNVKTARSLGLDIPPSLLAIADEVLE